MANITDRKTIVVFIVCILIIGAYCCAWIFRGLFFPSTISPKMNVISVSYLHNNTSAYDDVFLSHGDYYLGGFKNSLYSGKGKYYFDNGDQYIGEFTRSVYHGYGQYTFADKSYFIGNWRNNHRHGPGLAVLSNGDVFYGNWVDDHVSGIGYYYQPYKHASAYTMFFRDDIRYYQFVTNDNNRHLEYSSLKDFEYSKYSELLIDMKYLEPCCNLVTGDSLNIEMRVPRNGTKLFYDTFSGIYDSEFHDFIGEYHFFNDCFYRGKIRDSLFMGHGEIYYSDSIKLEATWKIVGRDHKKHSKTKFRSKRYDILPGVVDYKKISSQIKGYKQNAFKRYRVYQPSRILNIDSVRIRFSKSAKQSQQEMFYGRLDENYHYSFGEFYLKNGDVYYGSFKNSKYNGYGEYVWNSKKLMYSGNWMNGKFHGLGTIFVRENNSIIVIEALWDKGFLCRIFFVYKDKPGDRTVVEDFVHTIRREPLFPPPLKFRTGINAK